jgi:hypothetical protein
LPVDEGKCKTVGNSSYKFTVATIAAADVAVAAFVEYSHTTADVLDGGW